MHTRTDVVCAMKIIDKVKLKQSNNSSSHFELLKEEIEVLQKTNHPNIMRVFQLLEDDKNIYCAMELMANSLDEYLKNQSN